MNFNVYDNIKKFKFIRRLGQTCINIDSKIIQTVYEVL